MKKFKKIGDASIRVLETLKLLYKSSASIQDIIRHFEKIDAGNKVYTNEVILKYINTLKVFGFKILKQKDKYVLLNVLDGFHFNEKDLKTVYLLGKYANLFPEESVKLEMNNFLRDLERRFDDNTKKLSQRIVSVSPKVFKLNYGEYEKQIKEYEKYCLDKQRLKIIYKNSKNAQVSIMIEPVEIKYFENEIYLSVYNQLSAQIQDININSIIRVEQLPLKSNPVSMYSSVMFALTGALAKNYRLRADEKLAQVRIDGSVVIQNQKEDQGLLSRRLLRYGELCEVISPKSFRDEIKQLVQATFNQYVI